METLGKNRSMMGFLTKYKTVIILAAIIVVFAILNPVFIMPANLMNMIKRASYVALVGFGMTFIITLADLDLSVGSMAAIVGVTLAMMLGAGVPLILAIIIVFALSLGMGLLNGFIIVKGKINAFLVTLATMNIFRGIALTISEGRPTPITAEGFADFFGNGLIGDFLPTPIVIMVAFFVLTLFLYKRTKFGFYVRCIGGNPEAARVAGINVGSIKLIAFTLNGLYACVAALILAALMNSGMPDIGSDLALDAIAAVVLGGTIIAGGYGTVWGTLGGVLIMGALNSGMSILGAQSHVIILVKGIVIILAVLMQNVLSPDKLKAKPAKSMPAEAAPTKE
ncbi:MAG: ABC transporter permease [Christensenella sp.]|uniref:ABC transporter permease n=1 Tax=Christensenella sp. TaxID=1935934 RepID=UPI002B1F46FD|nr:ABC transporter permease [Christensenella sp.]MEA5003430.1 ABC transporter permease [Christensenella sp.]